MKIDLTICGVPELPDQEGKRWTHVVSIWDRVYLYDIECRERIKALAPRAQLLFSFFEDTDDPNYPGAPILRDVKRILDFTSQLPPRAKLLVHCHAGISRSTATAYAILCQHSKPGMEMKNLLQIESLRDQLMPNRLIVRHADRILNRDGAMLLHLPENYHRHPCLRPIRGEKGEINGYAFWCPGCASIDHRHGLHVFTIKDKDRDPDQEWSFDGKCSFEPSLAYETDPTVISI